jgi:serine phosphatase RsbU (regulator of sigma subunit)
MLACLLLALLPLSVTPDALARPDGLYLHSGWKYHPGDDPAWADPSFDDTAWADVPDTLMRGGRVPGGWNGIGWFRIRLAVGADVAGPIALKVWQRGASEVYLDGRLVHRFGAVGLSPDAEEPFNPHEVPVFLPLGPGDHVVAIRYSCQDAPDLASGVGRWVAANELALGFVAGLQPLNTSIAGAAAEAGLIAGREFGVASVVLTLGVLHLLLYLFRPRERANLYFSLFAFGCAAIVAVEYFVNNAIPDLRAAYFLGLAQTAVATATLLAFLAFVFASFAPAWMRALWGFAALVAAQLACAAVPALAPGTSTIRWVLQAAVVVATLAVLARALARRAEGARIIGAGALCVLAVLVRNLASNFVPIPDWLSYLIGVGAILGLAVAGSAYLGRRYARTSRDLEAQLAQVKALSERALEQERREAELRLQREQEKARLREVEAENERRARELEEARRLQLSMLPERLPDLPHVEVAAYMRTATEVGGDYYDFYVADGVLTVAVGDATGHGLQAGTVVTATKSLFEVLADRPDITGVFRDVTRALKRMKLGRLYMAMTLAKLEGRRLRLSAAGMPPALVYRAATGAVEEIRLKGMPLGAFAEFRYEQAEVDLAGGDTVLLMSDGFPEMFNPRREMLDYARAADLYRAAAHRPPCEIVEHLRQCGEAWAEGRPPDDDVTFVVLKMRENGF